MSLQIMHTFYLRLTLLIVSLPPPLSSQVLYFIPPLRAALLAGHLPEPDLEFCMACEMALLFRMLVTSHGAPCQVTSCRRRFPMKKGQAWQKSSMSLLHYVY